MSISDVKHKGEIDSISKSIWDKLHRFNSETDRIMLIFERGIVKDIQLTHKPTSIWRWLAKIYKPKNLRQREVAHFLASFFAQNLKTIDPQHASLILSLQYLWQKGLATESASLKTFVTTYLNSLQEAAKITKTREDILQEATKARITSKEAEDKAKVILEEITEKRKVSDEECQRRLQASDDILQKAKIEAGKINNQAEVKAKNLLDKLDKKRKVCDEQCQRKLQESVKLMREIEVHKKALEDLRVEAAENTEYAERTRKYAEERARRADELLSTATKIEADIIKARDDILQKANIEAGEINKQAEDKANARVNELVTGAQKLFDEASQSKSQANQLIRETEASKKALENSRAQAAEHEKRACEYAKEGAKAWENSLAQAAEHEKRACEYAKERARQADELLSIATKTAAVTKERAVEVQNREVEAKKREEEIKKREIVAKQREDQANDRCLAADLHVAKMRETSAEIVKEGQAAAEKIKAEAEEVLKQAKIQAASAVVQRSKSKEIGAKLLQLQAYRDVVIKCLGSKGLDDKVVYAHSLVLQTHPHFSAKSTFEENLILWSKSCSENQAKDGAASAAVTRVANTVFSTQAQEKLMPTTLDLSDYSEEAVQQLMNYWYTGKTDPIAPQIIIELHQLAEFLVLDELAEQCVSSFTKLVDEVPDLLSVLPTPRNIAHYSKLDARFCTAFIKHRSPGSLNAGQLKLFKEFIAPILVAQFERDRKLELAGKERAALIEDMEAFFGSNQLPHRKNLEDHARTIGVFIGPFLAQYNVSNRVWQQAMISYLSNSECIPSCLPVRDKLALCQAAIDSNLIDSDFGYACLHALCNNDELSPDSILDQIMEYFNLPASDQDPILTNLLFSQFHLNETASGTKCQEYFKFLSGRTLSSDIRFLLAGCRYLGIGCPKDSDAGIKQYKELCEENYTFGQITVAGMELSGNFSHLIPLNYLAAFERLQKLANTGHIKAKALLGDYYIRDTGTRAADIPMALSLYEWSSKRGCLIAHLTLGSIYQQGSYGQAIDQGKAFIHMRKAAQLGENRAMLPLSKFYETGYSGIPINMALALKWARKAQEFGIKEAAEEIERLSKIVGS